eukprot:2247242-Pyramimonas_sp.AAC.1
MPPWRFRGHLWHPPPLGRPFPRAFDFRSRALNFRTMIQEAPRWPSPRTGAHVRAMPRASGNTPQRGAVARR